MRALEESILVALKACGVNNAKRQDDTTGIWIDNYKVAAIGVKCRRWISMHGLAVNVEQASLDNFEGIVPCGLKGRKVGCLNQFLPKAVEPLTVREFSKHMKVALEEVFQVEMQSRRRGRKNDTTTGNRKHRKTICNDKTQTENVTRRTLFQGVVGTAAASVVAAISVPQAKPALALSQTAPMVAATGTSDYLIPTPAFSKDKYWPLGKIAFSLLPLAGGSRRATVEQTIAPEIMWTHDQIQGIVNVNVPVRQTVVKLSAGSGGGLWVHNPVAPTPELLRKMSQLEAAHGPVRHIVLGSVALEHKATFGAFSRNFPSATVWVQPGQWSFPVQYDLEFLGVSQRRPFGTLRDLPPQLSPKAPEWTRDIEYEILGPLKFRSVGSFSETAFYHKATKSLIVTDVVLSVTEEPPPIIQEDPRALLFHSRDSASDRSIVDSGGDTPELRRKGWRRMVQFGLIFYPSHINVPSVGKDVQDKKQVPKELRNLGEGAVPFNLYPWTWQGDGDVTSFQAISNGGALFCPPILTKLILDREPTLTLAWVDRVCNRFKDMKRVVPCHLNNDIKAASGEFYHAFDSLRCTNGGKQLGPLKEDLRLLQNASDILTMYGVVSPTKVESSRV